MTSSYKMTVEETNKVITLKPGSVQEKTLPMQSEDAVEVPTGDMDYDKLINKPTLNGKVIEGDINEEDPTVSDWAKEETRPVYSAEDVGAISKDDVVEISIEALEQLWNSL